MRAIVLLVLGALVLAGCNGTECAPACARETKECKRGGGFESTCELECKQTSQGPCISEYADYTTCVATAKDAVDCASLEPPSCSKKFDVYSKCLQGAD
jgi:hypothetical protein